jgi:L-threonylcarbamoyladenylate synthase
MICPAIRGVTIKGRHKNKKLRFGVIKGNFDVNVVIMDNMIQMNSIDFQKIDPKIATAIAALKEGKIVLMQTQTVWTLICLLTDEPSFHRMLTYKRHNLVFNYECLVDSIDLLKKYVPNLSPRVETLLSFHARPLGILLEATNLPAHIKHLMPDVSFRLDSSEGISTIISLVGQGLWTTTAFSENDAKGNLFDLMDEKAKALADEIILLNPVKNSSGEEAVLVRLDEEDNLEFLRE